MDIKDKDTVSNQAKQMLIQGESWDTIINATGLRLKDLKRIQKDEISSHF
ncbi:hypothetical protein KPL40_09240 [Clostridium gasigenes]|nr:hypothetical protein [Clostridium gasigenes]MBU3132641.1 hypothetical protein [Clostridium gasigenes]